MTVQTRISLNDILATYSHFFERGWQAIMTQKLGFSGFVPTIDQPLVDDLLRLLPMVETDMTLFFRLLAQVPLVVDKAHDRIEPLMDAFYQPRQLTNDYRDTLTDWLARYARRLCEDPQENGERVERMRKANPKYVLRNYLAQLAIDKVSAGDYSLVNELLEVMRHPYEEQPDKERFARKRPEWARHRPGCSMLSCSS